MKKKSKAFKIIVEILLVLVILVAFYQYAYPYIFIKTIESKLMTKYNTAEVEVKDPIACAICTSEIDGTCANTKIKLNCFTYDATVNGAKEYIKYDNFKLDISLLNIAIELYDKTNELVKNIDYDNITYREGNNNEINITVDKNLEDLLNRNYLKRLDNINLGLYEKYPEAKLPGNNYLNFYINYKDGYVINMNQLKSGVPGDKSNYMIFSNKNTKKELYYVSPIISGDVDSIINAIKNLK